MLGPASLHLVRKASAKPYVHSARNVALNALVPDLVRQAASAGHRAELSHIAAGISAIALNMMVASTVMAETSGGVVLQEQEQALVAVATSALFEGPSAVDVVAAPALKPTPTEEPASFMPTAELAVADEAPEPVLAMSTPDGPTLLAATEEAPAAIEVVDLPAEPAVTSPVVSMGMPAMPAINPETDIKTLVSALISNEQFIAALVNNEAFLDRLAGEDRVVEELARRKGFAVSVEAQSELGTELRRRQAMIDALAARGEEAVLAVADAAKKAAEDATRSAQGETREADTSGELGVVSSGKSALVAMEMAVELLEDSQELLEAVEGNPSSTPLSALVSDDKRLQREFKKMEAAVARAEQSVNRTLENNAAEPLTGLRGAVRDLYAGEQELTVNRAYSDLVSAVAELQRAYGVAVSKAVGHAVSEVVEVEEAATQGAEKTKQLLSQKADEVRSAVRSKPRAIKATGYDESAPKPRAPDPALTLLAPVPVFGAFLFWLWATFVQPRSRYGR